MDIKNKIKETEEQFIEKQKKVAQLQQVIQEEQAKLLKLQGAYNILKELQKDNKKQ